MPRGNTEQYKKIDSQIGAKIQQLRISQGMSREELADRIGVTHQQTQKYEKGQNRLSVGRLMAVSDALDTPFTYFLEADQENPRYMQGNHQRMCMEVARNFMKIKNPLHQDAVNVMTKILAQG